MDEIFVNALEREASEQRLRESEQRYRNLVENSQGLICTHDMEGTLLSVNPAVAHLSGYQPSEMVGSNLREFLMPAVRPFFGAYLERIRQEKIVSGLLRGMTKDGHERVWAYRNVRFEEAGKPAYVLGHAIDITERVQAEEALRETEARLRTVIANSPIVLFALDRVGVFTLSEGKGLDALGLQPGEVVGKSVFEVYAEVPQILESCRRALKGESFTSITKVAGLIFEVVHVPLQDRKGVVTGVIGVATDITAREQAGAKIRNQAEMLNIVHDAVIAIDLKGRITYWNQGAARLYGWPAEEAVDKLAIELLFRETPALYLEASQSVITQGEWRGDMRQTSKDGAEFFVASRWTLRHADKHGARQSIIIANTDVSDKKQLETNLFGAVEYLISDELRIVGESPAIAGVRQLIGEVAPTDLTVIITGETGTGKELVAKVIHKLSGRSGEFVDINCGAIPADLFESEIFGYNQGAFTGAATPREGLLEQAAGGTFFLDEVSSLKLEHQVKLLRVLEEKEFQRVGGRNKIPFTARVIAASNRDLKAAIDAGEFRNDLYYRLEMISIVLPPLREHMEDVPLLAEHFAARICAKLKIRRRPLTADAGDKLGHYTYPGNARELFHVIQRAILLDKKAVRITADHIFFDYGMEESLQRGPSRGEVEEVYPEDSIKAVVGQLTLDEVNAIMIEQALLLSPNSQSRAAKMLGLTPDKLRYRRKKGRGPTSE